MARFLCLLQGRVHPLSLHQLPMRPKFYDLTPFTTAMRSALRMMLRRRAMMMLILPVLGASRLFWMRCSVTLFRALVAGQQLLHGPAGQQG